MKYISYLINTWSYCVLFCHGNSISIYIYIYICLRFHYNDVIKGAMASQITSLTIVCSNVCSGADQRKYQSSASLAFVWGIHQWPVNFPNKWPVTRKCFHLMTSLCASLAQGKLVTVPGKWYWMIWFFFDGTGTKPRESALWPLLLTWFNFNPSMDK